MFTKEWFLSEQWTEICVSENFSCAKLIIHLAVVAYQDAD